MWVFLSVEVICFVFSIFIRVLYILFSNFFREVGFDGLIGAGVIQYVLGFVDVVSFVCYDSESVFVRWQDENAFIIFQVISACLSCWLTVLLCLFLCLMSRDQSCWFLVWILG